MTDYDTKKFKYQMFTEIMTTETEEWILHTHNHVSNPGIIYTEMDLFQGIFISFFFFPSIMNHNDYIHMADFTLKSCPNDRKST